VPFLGTLRSASLGLTRHRGATIVAVATLTFMLSALTIFLVLASGLDTAASGLEAKANVIADLKGWVGTPGAQGLEQTLQTKWPHTHVSYVTKGDALAQFRKTFAGDSTMLAALQGNPLPASIQVKTRDAHVYSRIAHWLAADPRVSHVIFNPNLTSKLIQITDFVRIAGLALVVGLAFLALVIVVNTTHLTVEARRDEIEVMRLIGASHRFVRNPLILEGILLGLVGAGLACVAAVGLYFPLMNHILVGSGNAALALLPINTTPSFVTRVAATVVGTGAFVGAAGSYISIRRFAGI